MSSIFDRITIITITSVVFTMFCCPISGQDLSIEYKQQMQKGPVVHDRVDRGYSSSPNTMRAAPAAPVHAIAEWEESEGVMINWWNEDLVNRLQEVNKVYVPVDSQSEKNWWINKLNTAGIPLTNFEWVFITTDTIWTRDYGPWFVWDGNKDMGICDYSCDGHGAVYGPNDSAYPYNFAVRYGINYYDSGIEHVGGNWYPNGYETAFSSDHIYTMNPYETMVQTNTTIHDYWGIDNYYTVPVAYWTIEHLDCWIKPADPETLVVVEYEEGSDYYHYADRMNEYYETLESPWGRPYVIHRLPMFKMSGSGWYEYKPYCNSLVSNKRVYVPITYSSDDAVALGVFQDAFEGYEIVGVDHMGLGFNDAVHCRTRNFHKCELIRIYPYPPGDTEETAAGYDVLAEVIPPKGTNLAAGYPVIRWTTTGGAPFSDVVMSATGQPDEYTATLPAQPHGTTVSYYIEAENDGGLSALYPLVAPDGMMHFDVRVDTEAPALSRIEKRAGASEGQWPFTVRTLCRDDMTTPEVTLKYAINGQPQPDVTMTREALRYWYSGMTAGSVTEGDVVTYHIEASDNASSPNISVYPPVGEVYCPITDGGSIAVVDFSSKPRTGHFIAQTLGDLGMAYTYYTTWPTDWSAHDTWFICLGFHFADNYVLSTQEANEIVTALQNGANIYLESNDTWCWDAAKTILDPWFMVDEISDGDDISGGVYGPSEGIMNGIDLEYAAENAYMDEIGALSSAKMMFRSTDGRGRAVQYDSGTYKSVACSFGLGGLCDGSHPDSRKEILIRLLEFFGHEVGLYTGQTARIGSNLPILIQGEPGDQYLFLGSFADNYKQTGFGICRLDPAWLFYIYLGTLPGSGVMEFTVPIPRDESLIGTEVHLQAATGEEIKYGKCQLTNREIMTITD